MAGTHNIYQGADYGLDSNKYDSEFLGMQYKTPLSHIGLTTDARTANQLQSATSQLNTGAKAIEIQMAMNEVAESIPNQHLDELNRLRKLIGAEFTVHGALVEPTGVSRQGWDDTQRQQAERQMWTSLQRAKRVDPDGNVIVTFHSSNGLPEPETKVIDDQIKVDGVAQEKITGMMTVDVRTGQFNNIPAPKVNYLEGKEEESKDEIKTFKDEIKKINKDAWTQQLSRAAYAAQNGQESVNSALLASKEEGELPQQFKDLGLSNLYKMYKTPEGQKAIEENSNAGEKEILHRFVNRYNYGEIYIKEAYNDLQNLFNQAYSSAELNKDTDTLNKLKAYKNEIKDKIDYIKDPGKISDFAEEIRKGINLLNTIEGPQTVRPLKEWAIDKASDTFSNLAVKAYKEFKDKAPIISIENPPAGSGLSRAEDLKALIEDSRKKLVEKLKKEGVTEYAAKKEASKLIGATWDVGHINMIKKFGYDDKQLEKETETIGKFVKHVHLSDNFGMEHTELPMGMGNVPTQKHMDILDKYNDKLKKVVETGTWYQYFKTPPLAETLSAFGSPIYSMQMGPSWNNTYGKTFSGYFSGYGMNPDIHHSIYGSGFSNLPTELGGQMQGRSRMSGNPLE